MAIAKGKQLVMQDQDGIWLSAKLAGERTGLKRADLYQRAIAAEIRHQGEDKKGEPQWFHEADVTAFVRSRPAAGAAVVVKPKRKMTDKQLEAMHTSQWKRAVERDRNLYANNPGLVGGRPAGGASGIGAHQERVMMFQISENNKKKPNSDT